MTKKCSSCGDDKPIKEFYKHGRGKRGQPLWYSRCRECCCRDKKVANTAKALRLMAAEEVCEAVAKLLLPNDNMWLHKLISKWRSTLPKASGTDNHYS